MNTSNIFKTSAAIAAMLVLSVAQAQTGDKATYKASKDRIAAEFKAAKAACGSKAGNAKDICTEEAKAREKVSRAELEYAYTGKPADANKIPVARAEAAYAVAREKCDDLAGNAKDVCVKEAKAVEVKALAEARTSRKVGEARMDGAQEKREADYKVAAEKCDAMAGDAKSSCMAAAKLRFGKS